MTKNVQILKQNITWLIPREISVALQIFEQIFNATNISLQRIFHSVSNFPVKYCL
jgi:hypothetical protein